VHSVIGFGYRTFNLCFLTYYFSSAELSIFLKQAKCILNDYVFNPNGFVRHTPRVEQRTHDLWRIRIVL
jgi:hypothetical protein